MENTKHLSGQFFGRKTKSALDSAHFSKFLPLVVLKRKAGAVAYQQQARGNDFTYCFRSGIIR